jgi:hypothetical protein
MSNLKVHPKGHERRVRREMLNHAIEKFKLDATKWSSASRHPARADAARAGPGVHWPLRPEATPRRKRTVKVIMAKPELLDWVTNFTAKSEMFHPVRRPMIHPPLPWSDLYDGGYLHAPAASAAGGPPVPRHDGGAAGPRDARGVRGGQPAAVHVRGGVNLPRAEAGRVRSRTAGVSDRRSAGPRRDSRRWCAPRTGQA